MLLDMRPGRRRLTIRILVFTAANAASLLALFPAAFTLSYFVTIGATGWQDPGPEIIQGCEKSLACAEGDVFFPVLLVLAVCFVVVIAAVDVVVLRAWDSGRPTPSPVRWVRRQFRAELNSWRQMRAHGG